MNNSSSKCICNGTVTSSAFMIECESCDTWYHGECVSITEPEALELFSKTPWCCPQCTNDTSSSKPTTGSTRSKSNLLPLEFNSLSVNQIAKISPSYSDKCSAEFRHILSDGMMYATSGVRLLSSSDFTALDLNTYGLQDPILVENSSVDTSNNLGLRLPTSGLTLRDLERVIGSKTIIKSLNVSSQTESYIPLEEWSSTGKSSTSSHPRFMTYRLSDTEFHGRVLGPSLISQIDWKYQWYRAAGGGSSASSNSALPKSMATQTFGGFVEPFAYQDFSIVSGGASSWFHLLNGSMTVYLVPPTDKAYDTYEQWKKCHHSSLFLADAVDKVIKVEVPASSTLIIPSGYIYALYGTSSTSSMFFHGSFLHSFAIPSMIKAVEVEDRVGNEFRWKASDTYVSFWRELCFTLRKLRNKSQSVFSTWESQGYFRLAAYLQEKNDSNDDDKVPQFLWKSSTPVDILKEFHTLLSCVSVKHYHLNWTASAIDAASKLKHKLKDQVPVCDDDFIKCEKCLRCVRNHCICGKESATVVCKSTFQSMMNSTTAAPSSNPVVAYRNSLAGGGDDADLLFSQDEDALDSLWKTSNNSNNNDSVFTESSNNTQRQSIVNSGIYEDLGLEIADVMFSDAFDMSSHHHHSSLQSSNDAVAPSVIPTSAHSIVFEKPKATESSLLTFPWMEVTEDDPTEDEDGNSKHRASCHRCGNLRKRNVRCLICPHIFCQKCAEKMVAQHGPECFNNGCPVCKSLCCCGKNRSVNCTKKYHCYKKCPSTKRPSASSLSKPPCKIESPSSSSSFPDFYEKEGIIERPTSSSTISTISSNSGNNAILPTNKFADIEVELDNL